MSWAIGGGVIAALLMFSMVYATLRLRRRGHERTVLDAVTEMVALLHARPSPQRALLGEIADVLAAQDAVTVRLAEWVYEAEPASRDEGAEALLAELLELAEPHRLVADFVIEHAGSAAFGAALTSYCAGVVRRAAGPEWTGPTDRLAEVARAVFDAGRPMPAGGVPQVGTVDPEGIAEVLRSLDDCTRRQLRLVALLHGQAELVLRRRRTVPGGLDLTGLAVCLDAVGEALVIAAERSADGAPMEAVHLLASLRLPSPAGFPGRIFSQESLALARPLAELGVVHRLAVARWAAGALSALPPSPEPEPGGSSFTSDIGTAESARAGHEGWGYR